MIKSMYFDKIAILWGGGLGDLLVLRPLLLALERANIKTTVITTAKHLSYNTTKAILGETTEIVHLEKKLPSLMSFIQKRRGFYDCIYLGPYPRTTTRMFSFVFKAKKRWTIKHPAVSPFIFEQIMQDVKMMGLQNFIDKKYPYEAIPWPNYQTEINIPSPIIIHLTSKQQWKTTVWPITKWLKLIDIISNNTKFPIYIIGTKSESNIINGVIANFNHKTQIKAMLSSSLEQTFRLLQKSKGVICHNSGILHLATMLKKPTVSITGASAYFWRPPYPWVKNISSGMCNLACNQYNCPIPFWNAKCIQEISAEKVWDVAKEHLGLY